MRRRHAAFYLKLVEQHQADLRTNAHDRWSRRLASESANLRTAVHWWIDNGKVEELARFIHATSLYYWQAGLQPEMASWIAVAENAPEQMTITTRARLLLVECFVAIGAGRIEDADRLANDAASSLRDAGDDSDRALAWILQAQARAMTGDLPGAVG